MKVNGHNSFPAPPHRMAVFVEVHEGNRRFIMRFNSAPPGVNIADLFEREELVSRGISGVGVQPPQSLVFRIASGWDISNQIEFLKVELSARLRPYLKQAGWSAEIEFISS